MTAIGKIEKGRPHGVRCDGCGRISGNGDGYYFDRKLKSGGVISSKGRECEHDFCKQCEAKNPDEKVCPACRRKVVEEWPICDACHREMIDDGSDDPYAHVGCGTILAERGEGR